LKEQAARTKSGQPASTAGSPPGELSPYLRGAPPPD